MIKTRCAMRRFLALFTLSALLPLQAEMTRAGTPLPERPNIIIIQADDHGWGDLAANGQHTGALTPHLDRLAESGIRFTNGYATSPICSPSRIGLLTGRYQQRLNNWGYGGPGMRVSDDATIAEVLAGAGYRCGFIGKYHVNRSFDPDTRNFPLRHGFDYFYGFNDPATHYLQRGRALYDDFMRRYLAYTDGRGGYPGMFYEPWWENEARVEPTGFSTDLFTEAAISFATSTSDQPFFLLCSYNAIHDATYQLPEEELRARGIEPAEDWDPASQNLDAWKDQTFSPHVDRDYLLGQLKLLDANMGRLLTTLDAQGLRESTMVIYLSDNGGSTANASRNDPLRGGKFTLCEGGIRVPFIVSWPGAIAGGRVVDNVVSALDLLPTAAALAAGAAPEGLDGINLVPLLDGSQPGLEHETLVWDAGTRKSIMWAVRHGDWKLVFQSPSPRITHAEHGIGYSLYHLGRDESENANVIDQYPEKAAELGTIHRRWLDEMLRDAAEEVLREEVLNAAASEEDS